VWCSHASLNPGLAVRPKTLKYKEVKFQRIRRYQGSKSQRDRGDKSPRSWSGETLMQMIPQILVTIRGGGGRWVPWCPDLPASTWVTRCNRANPVTLSGWWRSRGQQDPVEFLYPRTKFSGATLGNNTRFLAIFVLWAIFFVRTFYFCNQQSYPQCDNNVHKCRWVQALFYLLSDRETACCLLPH